jgi:hypothetical protein
MKFNSSWHGVPNHYEVYLLLSILLLLGVTKTLPDDIFLFFYSSTRVGLHLGGSQRKQGGKKKSVYNPAASRGYEKKKAVARK